MRPRFDLLDTKFDDDARVKFIYTSPEHHQNIEISIDGEQTSVEVILDAFQRFLGALGVPIPPNVSIELVEHVQDEPGSEENKEDDDEDNKGKGKKKG
jgi:hypothetical protein